MTSLAECNGEIVTRTECLLQVDTTDLTYCECNLCQVYTTTDHFEPSPPLENSMAITHMRPGIESNHTLCLNHWTFFKFDTASPSVAQVWNDAEVRDSTRSGEARIDAALGSLPTTPQQIVLTFDTAYNALYDRFTTVDAFLHLDDNLPNNWERVFEVGYPAGAFTPGDPPDTSRFVDFPKTDSFTYTIGYDETNPITCTNRSMPRYFYMGVRCGNPVPNEGSWARQDTPCQFRVRYVMIPQYLTNGDVLGPLPMAPSTTHAYSVLVGGYDVIRFAIERVGDNLTYACQDYGLTCASNGGGVVGSVYYAINECPTREGGSGKARLLSNETQTMRQEWFCTAPGDEGRYYVALRAGPVFNAGGLQPGYVMFDGRRVMDPELEPLPGQALNRLKPARGYYTVSVLHRAFQDGPMVPGEVREGCVSYNQMRRFTIVTTGPSDASLYLNATAVDGFLGGDGVTERPALSSVFVRRNRAPTRDEFDVAVHAPEVGFSTSPCYVDDPYEYHIMTYLSEQLRANHAGLKPTLFALRAKLLTATGPTYGTAGWPEPGNQPGVMGRTVQLTTPFSAGGSGHICCHQFRYFILRNVPPTIEPVIIINVTAARRPERVVPLGPDLRPLVAHSGGMGDGGGGLQPTVHVQAVFLKRATCPVRSDVLPDESGCVEEEGKTYSRCNFAKLVKYDEYSGQQTYLRGTAGYGGFPPPLADEKKSDWYVGVQAYFDEPAEFSLRLGSRSQRTTVQEYKCDRLHHFCPQEIREFIDARANSTANQQHSGAVAARPLSVGLGGLLSAGVCALMVVGRRPARSRQK